MEKDKSLSQEEIKFQLIAVKHFTGWNRTCPYKSIGSIIHWIYVYCGLNIAERITVSIDHVNLNDKIYATFILDDEYEIPVFTFLNDNDEYLSMSQEAYLKGLKEKWLLPFDVSNLK